MVRAKEGMMPKEGGTLEKCALSGGVLKPERREGKQVGELDMQACTNGRTSWWGGTGARKRGKTKGPANKGIVGFFGVGDSFEKKTSVMKDARWGNLIWSRELNAARPHVMKKAGERDIRWARNKEAKRVWFRE